MVDSAASVARFFEAGNFTCLIFKQSLAKSLSKNVNKNAIHVLVQCVWLKTSSAYLLSGPISKKRFLATLIVDVGG